MPHGLESIKDWFPNLEVKKLNEAEYHVEGELLVNATYQHFFLDECFSILIKLEDYPNKLPICIETSNKVKDYHVNGGAHNEICLASPISIHQKISQDTNIVVFINTFVIPFFVSFRYHQKYGVSPFGELDHGGKGLLSEYNSYFKTNDETSWLLLTYATKELYRGHHQCPCGSGLPLRKCHGSKLRCLFENYPLSLLLADIKNCSSSLESKQITRKELLSQRVSILQAKEKKLKGINRPE